MTLACWAGRLVLGCALTLIFATPILAEEKSRQQALQPPISGAGLRAPEARPPDLAPVGEEIPAWQARWELARLLSYVKRYAESVAEYQKLLKEKPDLAQARLEMAKVLFWDGKTSEASKVLGSLPEKELDAESRLTLIDIAIAQKEYPKAEQMLVAQLATHPDDDAARFRLAEIFSWLKRYEDSLAAYRIILQHRPDDTQVRRKYAYVLIWAGKRDAAVEELRKSLKE